LPGQPLEFSDPRALIMNCTLKPTPHLSHTGGLIGVCKAILEKNHVVTELLRPVDYRIAPGTVP